MLERLTPQAHKAVILAQDEASHFKHDYVGTGHLLLGLLLEGNGVAAQVLSALDVKSEAARDQLASIMGYGEENTTAKPFTPPSKKVLVTAREEARKLGHDDVDTEHMLLALAGDPEGVAAKMLANLNVDEERLRTRVLSLRSEEPSNRNILDD
jgi:ATP-dependent Clp protease ATP-binding subunit ClpC